MFRALRVLLVFLILESASVWPQSRVGCSTIDSRTLKHVVRYCVLFPPRYDSHPGESAQRSYPVLYFLHGLGDTEETLRNDSAWKVIDLLRQQHKIGEFLVVAPEGGQSFYINSADGKTPYSDFFLDEFIPYIELKYRVLPGRSGRGISGFSMGGYGALRFAFAHPELFSSVSAQSAALMTQPPEFNIYDDPSNSASRVLAAAFGRPVDLRHWNENQPVALAKKTREQLRDLAIYFNCGQSDNFGFDEGARKLHAVLKKEGVVHEYHLYAGDHSSGYFHSHLAETLQFHSRIFEAENPTTSRPSMNGTN